MILGSVSCTHLDSFVMPSASSGTSGSHVSAGNFPVTRYTVDHGCTPVSLTPKLSSGSKGGSYGNKILYKNLDLTQDFPNKISFHFLWVKMLPKNLPKIFRCPEMCPLDKILAQDFQMAAFTKILGRRDTSVVPLLSTENCKTLF